MTHGNDLLIGLYFEYMRLSRGIKVRMLSASGSLRSKMRSTPVLVFAKFFMALTTASSGVKSGLYSWQIEKLMIVTVRA